MKSAVWLMVCLVWPAWLCGQGLKVENPGAMVNSAESEFNPIISPDGRTLYFVRTGHPGNKGEKGSQEIWFAQADQDGTWQSAVRPGSPFNLAHFNAVLGMTPDGNTVLVKGVYKNGRLSGKGFSLIHKMADGWAAPEKLNITGLEEMDRGRFNGAFLTNDGKTLLLYFSESPFDDHCDLYVSFLKKENSWSRPLSLGKNINTDDYDEICPFLASDGQTLYFSSDRKGGLGSHDIYMVRRLGNSWVRWSKAENLGEPVNTPGWEAYYSLAASGELAYLTSTRESLGKEDIVRIRLKQEVKPNLVVLVRGVLTDSRTGRPLDALITYQLLPDGTEAGQARTNPADGSYQIILPYGNRYAFSARADGFFAVSDNLDLTAVGTYTELERPLSLVPIEVGSVVRLNNIFFETGKSELMAASIPEIERVARLMKENPGMEIEISGHTDQVGQEEANQILSTDRANAVRDKLMSLGVSDSRVRAMGYGESKPVSTNETEEGRALNRRVEFVIIKK